MTMDKSAIEQLQQAQAISNANEVIPKVINGLVALPDSFSKVDLEKYMPNRRNYRGKFETVIIDEFADYVEKHQQKGMTCFVNPDSMTATTIFDLIDGDKPLHGDHVALVALRKTPEYAELLEINNDTVKQQVMAEFMEDHIDFLSFFDADGIEINRTKAVSAIRKIDISASQKTSSEVGDYRSERSALETIKAESDGGLPASIAYTCIPYESLDEYEFLCRLAISQGANGVVLRLSVRSLEQKKAEMAEEFAETITEKLKGKELPIFRGKFQY